MLPVSMHSETGLETLASRLRFCVARVVHHLASHSLTVSFALTCRYSSLPGFPVHWRRLRIHFRASSGSSLALRCVVCVVCALACVWVASWAVLSGLLTPRKREQSPQAIKATDNADYQQHG